MTNPIAFWLAALIATAIGANAWFGWDWHIFLGQKFLALIDWMKFWR